MMMMLLGLLVFVGTHVVASMRGLRASLIARVGETAYRGYFSLLAASGVALTAYGYVLWRASGPASIWDPPLMLRHVTLLLMLLASVAAIAAYVPSHLRAWMRHPLLAAVIIWAVAHLLANGDAASVMLFGAVLAWALYDLFAQKRRGVEPAPVPAGWMGDALAVVGGVVLYGLLAFVFHPYVIGVPVM